MKIQNTTDEFVGISKNILDIEDFANEDIDNLKEKDLELALHYANFLHEKLVGLKMENK